LIRWHRGGSTAPLVPYNYFIPSNPNQMFDELWSEIQDAPGEIFDLDIPELQDKEKFNFDEYLKGNYDY
jgi:hypothetical protein